MSRMRHVIAAALSMILLSATSALAWKSQYTGSQIDQAVGAVLNGNLTVTGSYGLSQVSTDPTSPENGTFWVNDTSGYLCTKTSIGTICYAPFTFDASTAGGDPWDGTSAVFGTGGGAVSSVFGRIGVVTAQSDDYSLFYQAKSTNLDAYAAINPSANVKSLLGASNYTTFRSLLGLAAVSVTGAYNDITGRPDLGSGAYLDTGTAIGNLAQLADDGSGNPSLPIASLNLPTGSDYLVNGLPLDISDLTDRYSLLGGITGVTSLSGISDWPAAVSATEVATLDGVRSNIQTQIDALTVGAIPHVASGDPLPGACNWNTTDFKLRCRLASGDVYASAAFTLESSYDTTPDVFAFTDVTGATIGTVYTSDPVTIAGIDAPATISVSGGSYSINSTASFTTAPGTVASGDLVRARVTSSGSASTAVAATVTIGGVSDAFDVTTASGSSYLVSEGFETTGVPTGWFTVAGTPNYDDTSAAYSGSQSISFPAASARAGVDFAAQSDVWIGAAYKQAAWPGITSTTFRLMNTGGTANLAEMAFRADGRVQTSISGGTTDYGDPTYTSATGAWAFVKVHYVAGSGSNASCTVYLSTDGMTWHVAATTTNGTSMENVGQLQLKSDATNINLDDVRVSPADFDY